MTKKISPKLKIDSHINVIQQVSAFSITDSIQNFKLTTLSTRSTNRNTTHKKTILLIN